MALGMSTCMCFYEDKVVWNSTTVECKDQGITLIPKKEKIKALLAVVTAVALTTKQSVWLPNSAIHIFEYLYDKGT